jgi:hypothetical protein
VSDEGLAERVALLRREIGTPTTTRGYWLVSPAELSQGANG